LKDCPIKYYPKIVINDLSEIKINESKNICKKCNPECSVCSEFQDNCLSCEQSYFYLAKNKKCLKDCPQGFYKNFISLECMPCDSSCLECKGKLVNDCIKCNENFGMKLNNGLCLKDTGVTQIICPLGFIEIEANCVAYKTCIKNFNAFLPKIFSIDIDDFIYEVDLKLKYECKGFWSKFSIQWHKDNPFYDNSIFSADLKILTIKNQFLIEGDHKFIVYLFYESNLIDQLISISKFQIDKVISYFNFNKT